MISPEQLPVQPGDVITDADDKTITITDVVNDETQGELVFYVLHIGERRWNFQLPRALFEKRVQLSSSAVMTRADAGGVEG